MSTPDATVEPPLQVHPAEDTPPPLPGVLGRHRWLVYVLPYLVFLLGTSCEPAPPSQEKGAAAAPADGQPSSAADSSALAPTANSLGLRLSYDLYPWIYTGKIIATLAAMALVWPGYRRYPLRLSPLAIVVGVAGIVAWVALAEWQRRAGPKLGLSWLNGAGTRSAYNPLEQLTGTAWAYVFLAVRFFGLAAVVPMIEEFFLRGFLLRFFTQHDWWRVPFGKWHATGVAIMTLAAAATHPAEIVAAAVWFSMVTWLMLRTRNIWDCVAAHAVTNFLMGAYVVATGNWHLM